MIQGIGLDIIELERIRRLTVRQPRFSARILTERELTKMASFTDANRKIEYLAGRYAAKEAFSKALGCGIGGELSFQDIDIINREDGRPELFCQALDQDTRALVSITHTRDMAAAQVILERSPGPLNDKSGV
ncbi:holo-ACP synthase [Salisediminibacterium selenitireducens]|uniref:Holo-[acyl-carrier-protein] synthase n=1 Tax=Bacillus selenitireducens (strain ATCC 700615 / DSM 15326 / MLS10) TaxID=439292 RepID=D6XXZ1_BACIE|nr:holo-ACP synthase [Salisediminibacterium selenitireducens]ADH98064.1 holo-acyl-carrier-protein synthase [[Bacillus] selenitireducens MLS10]